jgi:hypothetical protein
MSLRHLLIWSIVGVLLIAVTQPFPHSFGQWAEYVATMVVSAGLWSWLTWRFGAPPG